MVVTLKSNMKKQHAVSAPTRCKRFSRSPCHCSCQQCSQAQFAFTISFDNITATIFWRPSGVETVPTQIFGMLRNSVSPEINALGFVMIVITVGLPLMAGGLARYFAHKRR